MTPSTSTARERTLLLTLAGIQFTHIVDFMVMMPLGPQFTRLFGISDTQFGVLVSAYTLAAGVAGLGATGFIDRFERKTLLLWAYLAFGIATLACGLADTYGVLMAARIAAGLFGGLIGTLVQTIVGDAIPFERRGRAMGVVMASFSLATVAGVPASLWLAQAFGWHGTFIAIALASFAIGAVGLHTLPRVDAHLQHARSGSRWQALGAVLREPNHWRAFGLSALVMSAGFVTIPYLTIYMTANVGLTTADVPMIYLAGGVATLFTARAIGVLADRWGKVQAFRLAAAGSIVPLLAVTSLPPVPLWVVLIVTTSFFVLVSGRMVPAMALITAATMPQLRGTFMSLNGCVQSASMGVAALVGGMLISRDAAGHVTGYAHNGWLSAAVTWLMLWWVGHLRVQPATTVPARAPDPATVSAAPD